MWLLFCLSVFWPNTFSCLQGRSLSSEVQKSAGRKNYLTFLWWRKVAGTVLINYSAQITLEIWKWVSGHYLILLEQKFIIYLDITCIYILLPQRKTSLWEKLDCRWNSGKGKKGNTKSSGSSVHSGKGEWTQLGLQAAGQIRCQCARRGEGSTTWWRGEHVFCGKFRVIHWLMGVAARNVAHTFIYVAGLFCVSFQCYARLCI